VKRSGPLPRKSALRSQSRLRPVSRKRAKAIPLDKLLHQVVRLRDVTCQLQAAGLGRCGGNLQVSHIYPKGRYPSMRFRLENVLLSCWRHHANQSSDSWHTNPLHYAAWFNASYPRLARQLELMAAVPGKVDRKLDRLYLEAEAAKYGIQPERLKRPRHDR